MNLAALLAQLPALLQVATTVQATIAAIIAAFRANAPGELEGLTDAQIIARLLDKATTGSANADALIDRLAALPPDAPTA